MKKEMKKIMRAEEQFSQHILEKKEVSTRLGPAVLTFPHLAKKEYFAYPVSYIWENKTRKAFFISPDADKGTPLFVIKRGVVKMENVEKFIQEGLGKSSPWTLLNLAKTEELDKEPEEFLLRPSNELERHAEFGGQSPIRSGFINNARRYHMSSIDFIHLFGMNWQECEEIRVKPVLLASAKITDSDRYITVRPYEHRENIFTNTASPKFKTALKNGEEVFWVMKNLQRSDFHMPQAILDVFGMPANYHLISKVDWMTGVITSEAPVEVCACCGKPIRAVGEDIRRGILCEPCSASSNMIKRICDGITEGTYLEKTQAAVNYISANPMEFKEQLIRLNDLIKKEAS